MPDPIIQVLDSLSLIWTSLKDFLIAILSNNEYAKHRFVQNMEDNVEEILSYIRRRSPQQFNSTVSIMTGHVLQEELVRLTQKENGLHFSATNATFEQMEDFKIQLIGIKMQAECPVLWSLMQRLLTTDSDLQARKSNRWRHKELGRTPSKSTELDFEDDDFISRTDGDGESCKARSRHDSLILIV